MMGIRYPILCRIFKLQGMQWPVQGHCGRETYSKCDGFPLGLIERKYSRRHSSDENGQVCVCVCVCDTSRGIVPTNDQFSSLEPGSPRDGSRDGHVGQCPCEKTFALQFMLGFL